MNYFTEKTEFSTNLTQFDYTNCAHQSKYRDHVTKSANPKQVWKCYLCGKKFTEGRERPYRSDYIKLLLPYFLAGWAAYKAAQEVKVTPKTALRCFRWLNMRVPEQYRRPEPFRHFDSKNPYIRPSWGGERVEWKT